MAKSLINVLNCYYFPIFIFLIIITGDWDSIIRKIISFAFSILVIFLSLYKLKISNKIKIIPFLVLLYLLICLLTIFSAINPITSLYFFFRILVFFLIVLSLYFWLNSYIRYKILLKVIIICGILLGVSIIFSIFSGNYVTELEGNMRAGGLFSNVNTAGFICYSSMIFVYLQYLETRKKINYLILFLLFIAMVLTGSRASLLALFVSFLFYNLRFKLNKRLIVITGVLFINIVFVSLIYQDKITNILRLNRGLSAREVLYSTGLEVFKDYPFVGIGLGNLKELGSVYIHKVVVSNWRKKQLLDIGIQSSHNAYLETAVEIGIFGAFIFVLILLIIGRRYFISIKNKPSDMKNYYYLFWAFWMGVFVRSFFESNGIINRGWITIDIFFWILYVIFLRFETIRKSSTLI